MFKIPLLQRWYSLSNEAVEEGLIDRLSFIRFVGLSLDDEHVPDAMPSLGSATAYWRGICTNAC